VPLIAADNKKRHNWIEIGPQTRGKLYSIHKQLTQKLIVSVRNDGTLKQTLDFLHKSR
jgi:hypothetical protein